MAEIGNMGAGEEVVDDSLPHGAVAGKAASDGQPDVDEIPMPPLEDVEEEFDFDPFEGDAGGEKRWFAMALYYFSQRSWGMFDEMGTVWCLTNPIPVCFLGDNRFVLEFAIEEEYNFVIHGGPWRHKGDALTVATLSATEEAGGGMKDLSAKRNQLRIGAGSTTYRSAGKLPEDVSDALTTSVQRMAVDSSSSGGGEVGSAAASLTKTNCRLQAVKGQSRESGYLEGAKSGEGHWQAKKDEEGVEARDGNVG
ncbi:hypothetical protein C2845_PM05G21590 [Panicum miliaceum]|uniref:DUF4283 domain-containing protein n=1 Tax=Panicum miliaceum TaxID=4540 RepID=A0A3L6T271_PANMI|nr:hypothetical protein C2845_PM05G21590 [Panicum miliaceum]